MKLIIIFMRIVFGVWELTEILVWRDTPKKESGNGKHEWKNSFGMTQDYPKLRTMSDFRSALLKYLNWPKQEGLTEICFKILKKKI